MSEGSPLSGPEAVRTGAVAASKRALFGQFGALARDALGLDAGDVAERLGTREKLGSTGFGGGVAIPHAKLPGLPRDLAFAMLSPADAGAEHLKALARVSRRLRDPAFVAKLRGAGSPDALYAVWAQEDARDGRG